MEGGTTHLYYPFECLVSHKTGTQEVFARLHAIERESSLIVGDDTAAVEAAVKDYLAQRNEEWTGRYLVEEYPKLRDAEYKVFGRYVVYGILSEADKTALFDAVADTLAE